MSMSSTTYNRNKNRINNNMQNVTDNLIKDNSLLEIGNPSNNGTANDLVFNNSQNAAEAYNNLQSEAQDNENEYLNSKNANSNNDDFDSLWEGSKRVLQNALKTGLGIGFGL